MLALSIVTGCASVTHGTSQAVKIDTLAPGGKPIEGANCRVFNDKSDTMVLSGQSVPVRRSAVNLSIECNQPGYPPAVGQATSRVNSGMVGNILVGGLVGAAIDSSTGAGFNYPSWVQLVFGELRNFDRRAQIGDDAMSGVRAGTTQAADSKAALARPPEDQPADSRPVASTAAVQSPSPPSPPPPSPPAPARPPSAQVVRASQVPPDPADPAPGVLAPPSTGVASPSAAPPARVSMEDLRALLPAKP